MNFVPVRGRRTPAEVNLTPLVDLFLNILVFFLVSSTFTTESAFFVDLPEAKPSENLSKSKIVHISVSAEGEIAVGDVVTTMKELRKKLSEIPKERRNMIPVVVRADRGSKHGRVVEVIDVVRDTGLENIGIATRQVRGGQP